MTFETLFMYGYGLFQLYILSFRKTVGPSVLIFLFFVGALSCISLTIVLQAFVVYYFGRNPSTTAVLALIEELVKAAPVAFLLFRTGAGRFVGLLDGLLIGAAVGAGFGFAEDAIFTVENAQLPANVAAYGGLWNIIGSWIPGGWSNNQTWFPGHTVLAALTGAGLAFCRRMTLIKSDAIRLAVAIFAIGWIIFLHIGFNIPAAVNGGLGYVAYYVLSGAGYYTAAILFIVLVVFTYLEEAYARNSAAAGESASAAQGVRQGSLLVDVTEQVAALGHGWAYFKTLAVLNRHKCQLINVDCERRWSAKADGGLVAVSDNLRTLVQRDANKLALAPAVSEATSLPVAVSSFYRAWLYRIKNLTASIRAAVRAVSLRQIWAHRSSAGVVLYEVGLMLVSIYGFWLVFLSPFMNHSGAVAIANTAPLFSIATLGQILVFWRSVAYLRRSRNRAEPLDVSALIIMRCQTMLAWTGALGSLVAWKVLYDLKSYPYPFRPGEVLNNWNQFNSCYGPAGATSTTGAALAPVPPLIEHEASGTRPDSGW